MPTKKRHLIKRLHENPKGLGLFACALLLGGLAQWMAWQADTDITLAHQLPAWLLFITGGFLLVRASRRAGPRPAPESLPFALEAGLLALILAVAIVLRLYNLGAYPAGGFRDEGENGNVGIQLLHGEVVDGTDQQYPAYIEHNTQNAAGYFYPVAVSFQLFGISINSVRYVSVFFGILSVLAFWALARWLFGPLMGLFLAACLAAMRWHVNFSRIGFLGIMAVFLSLPMLLWLYRGLNAPAPPRSSRHNSALFSLALALALARGLLQYRLHPGLADTCLGIALGLPLLYYAAVSFKDERSRWLMLSAVALALAMYSYIAARLFVLLVALIVGHHLLTQQRRLKARVWLSFWACLAVALVGAAVLVLSSAASASNAAWSGSIAKDFGVGIIVLAGLGLVRFAVLQRELLKGWAQPLGLALGVGLVVAGPLYAYSVRNRTQVAARSYRVSIFNDQEDNGRPWGLRLLLNIPPTLGMMNVRGDANPRHNLPNEPMTDPLWGALFALGVFYALLNLRDPRAWLAMVLWQISLIAGYYSMEAPQAYRCICAIPAVLLFVGLALEPGLEPLRRMLRVKRQATAALLLLLPVLLIGGAMEVHTYFTAQRMHPGVWAGFSTGEYMMGEDLKALNSNGLRTRGLVQAAWADSYTFRFMTYPERNYEFFDPSTDVPLRPPESTQGGDFLYILGDDYLPLLGTLRSFYPHGIYREVRHPYNNELLYWTYWVSAADAARAGTLTSGMNATYYQDYPADMAHPEATQHWLPEHKVFQRVDPFILFNWTVTPVPGFFSAEWTGSLKVPRSGMYGFTLVCHSYGILEIDGKKAVERPYMPEIADSDQGRIHLSAGRHRIRLRYYEARHYSHLELWWTPPNGSLEVVPSAALSKQ
jgi:hypothetical protein